MEAPDVKEGFICPVCMQEQSSVTELHAHFTSAHSQEDRAVKQSLKEFVSRARQRIKKELLDSPQPQLTYKYRPEQTVDQELGVTTSHMARFRSIRDERVDHISTETNKLIIRLDKLLTKLPTDPVKRKAHEREVVAWVEDAGVALCPDCGRAFGVLRRRHHCRLCGFVLCGRCSAFLTAGRAQGLVPGAETEPALPLAQLAAPPRQPTARLGLRRSGSLGSLNSMVAMVDAVTGEQQLRICRHCDQKLHHREEQQRLQAEEPILAQFYTQLRELQRELQRLIPIHNGMLESLLAGESKYHLSDVNGLRVQILKTAERMDAMSKRIAQLGADSSEMTPWRQQLQSRVRGATTSFLKQEVVGLPQPPSEQQLEELRDRLREETEARLAQLRPPGETVTPQRSTAAPPRGPHGQVVYQEAWSPPSAAAAAADGDPLLQQMAIVRGYIREARQAHRYDELAMFEQNLRELQSEHQRRQQAA